MVEMTFEPEMLETLAKMKGKTFKSYEGYFPGPWPIIPDRVRFNLGSFAVDVECWYKEVENWRDFFWDPPCVLSCDEKPLGEPFPTKADNVRSVLVGERVTGVEVVTYAIEEEGSLDAVMDVAVVIRTKRKVYTFSRSVWFSSVFNFAEGDDISIAFSENECAELWAGEPDEGEPPEVKVTRAITVL